MDQEKAFGRCMEIWAELEGLEATRTAFVEIAQDAVLTSAEESDLIIRFDNSWQQVVNHFIDLKTHYIDLIATLK